MTKDSFMVNILVRWLIFLHVLSALTFFLAHGASAAMAFKVRKEKELARIRAMLDLSESTIEIMFLAFLGLLLSGVVLSFLLRIWNKGWVWTSLLLMIFVFIWMVWMNEQAYKTLRKLVGLPYRQGSKEYPAQPPASMEEVTAQLKKLSVKGLVIVGYVIPAIVLWLMIFKPF
jgi:Ca2+/Na+ antiporter